MVSLSVTWIPFWTAPVFVDDGSRLLIGGGIRPRSGLRRGRRKREASNLVVPVVSAGALRRLAGPTGERLGIIPIAPEPGTGPNA